VTARGHGGDRNEAEALAPRSPWRDLLELDALRRLARLASLRASEKAVWLGPGGERSVEMLRDLSECRTEMRATLEGLEQRSLSLVIAPELVARAGFDGALAELRPFLETDGVAVLVARTFVGPDLPAPVRGFWETKQGGTLKSVKAFLARFAALGFEPLTSEILAEPGLSEHDRELLDAEPSTAQEPAGGSRRGTSLGLFVGRRVEAASPPRWPRRGGAE